MKYEEIKEGEWVSPVKRGYRMACCDCGLVHLVDFKGEGVRFKVWRDKRATAAMRRKKLAGGGF